MLEHEKKDTAKLLICLLIAILLITFFFGLRPKDFNFSNNVNWIPEESGICFEKFGIAYTNPLIELAENNLFNLKEFSFEIALKLKNGSDGGFKFILVLHSGKDSEQLLIGQWRSWIICMNGDDYAHRRGTNRISLNISSIISKKGLLTITTGKEGTSIYLNGQLIRKKEDLKLKIPNGDKARLVLGNSVYGKNSWSGDIYGLAFYDYALLPQEIKLHYDLWLKDQNFSFAEKDKTYAVYFFDDWGNSIVLDHSGREQHIEIPSEMRILQKAILELPWKKVRFNSSFIRDTIINLVGFIPLGFFLTASLIVLGGTFNKHRILIAISVCFMVSLIIEISQAWIPSRSSQMLDLALNTLGGLIGVWICIGFSSQFIKKKFLRPG